jgi:hypothetical protein
MTNRLPRSFPQAFAARLGILAIALQLVLSFAHIHPLAAPEPQIVAQHSDGGGPGDIPTAAHDCAICANIAAFSTLSLPAATVIAVTTRWIRIVLPTVTVWALPSSAYRLFHTRAPPAAQNH